jgi:hypothetical protein
MGLDQVLEAVVVKCLHSIMNMCSNISSSSNRSSSVSNKSWLKPRYSSSSGNGAKPSYSSSITELCTFCTFYGGMLLEACVISCRISCINVDLEDRLIEWLPRGETGFVAAGKGTCCFVEVFDWTRSSFIWGCSTDIFLDRLNKIT